MTSSASSPRIRLTQALYLLVLLAVAFGDGRMLEPEELLHDTIADVLDKHRPPEAYLGRTYEGITLDDDLIERKKAARKRVRAALKELTETQMSAESTAICASLLSTLQIFKETSDACVQRPLRLGLYVHCAKLREVDTRPLLKTALALGDACEVYVPIVDAPADGNDGVGPAMRFLKIQNLDKGEFIIFTYGQLEND